MGTGQNLYKKAKMLIPGGTQLLSKRPEQFLPDFWPAYYKKAKGCHVWDLDDIKYTDMSYMGIGACSLGYADDDVNKAVSEAVDNGNMSTLNAPEEVELAEKLISLHPWSDMARYTRGGGEAMAVAVRIARASTKKDIILFSGYHGWHDWYLSANLADDDALDGQLLPGLTPNGVVRNLKGSVYPFYYNDEETFKQLVDKYSDRIGGVVVEAIRNDTPKDTFFSTIRSVTNDLNVPLIIDEVSSGFRLNCGGAHLIFGVEPDIAVFAKGISNGYPMGVILGKKKYMDAAQDSFISSTYWTERIGPVAALATIKKMEEEDVASHLIEIGTAVQKGWENAAIKAELVIEIGGIFPLGHFVFKEQPLIAKTIFTQEMLKRGFLATNSFYACFSHTEVIVNDYLKNVEEVFIMISSAIKVGQLKTLLDGEVCHSGFKRLS